MSYPVLYLSFLSTSSALPVIKYGVQITLHLVEESYMLTIFILQHVAAKLRVHHQAVVKNI
jgi:hypothetical protein